MDTDLDKFKALFEQVGVVPQQETMHNSSDIILCLNYVCFVFSPDGKYLYEAPE